MLDKFEYSDPIVTKYRRVNIPISQVATIDSFGAIPLQEYPDKMERVVVTGLGVTWIEASKPKDILDSPNKFYVDYSNGIVYFHISRIGEQLAFDFYGKGIEYLPASRIYTKQEGGNIVETLGDLEESRESAETVRASNESVRIVNENTRISNEVIRQNRLDNQAVWENYSISNQYNVGNKVLYNGSSFICIQESLNNTPPLLPTISNTYWRLIAQRGVDGSGSVSKVNNYTPDTEGNIVIPVVESNNPKITGVLNRDRRVFEKFLGIKQTIASSPHQKVKVKIPNSHFSGYFDVTVSGNYGHYNFGGKTTKRLSGAMVNTGNTATFNSYYKDVDSITHANSLSNNIQISDIKYDVSENVYYVEIACSLNLSNQYYIGVHISAFNNTDLALTGFENSFSGITLSNFYADSIELPKAFIHFKNVSSELVVNLNSERVNGVKIFKTLTTPVGAVQFDQWNTSTGIKTYVSNSWI